MLAHKRLNINTNKVWVTFGESGQSKVRRAIKQNEIRLDPL